MNYEIFYKSKITVTIKTAKSAQNILKNYFNVTAEMSSNVT